MPQYISITSGSKPILLNIIKRYPSHRLHLYKSDTEDNFSLIDWLPTKPIFKSPITYKIIKSSNLSKVGSCLNLFYFSLSHKELQILLAYVNKQLASDLPKDMSNLFLAQDIKNSSNIMVGSAWSNNKLLSRWLQSSFITQFLDNHSNNGFHNNLVQIR